MAWFRIAVVKLHFHARCCRLVGEYNGASTTPEVATEESGRITIEQYVYPAGENGVSMNTISSLAVITFGLKSPFNGRSTGELIWDYVSQYNRSGRIE